MKNKDKIKTKAGVILIALLMIIISIGSVLGGTVTNTDVKTTTTDSSLEINYSDGWIRADNATVDNQSLTASEFNEWNLAYEHIGDPFYNASAAAGVSTTLINQWSLGYEYRGDPYFNASDAEGFTWAMAAGWNSTSGAQKAPSLNLITNSKNNSWAVTEGNLALALDDASDYGSVWVGSNLTITSEIRLNQSEGKVLDFLGHKVTLGADITFLNVTACKQCIVKNVHVVTHNGQTMPVVNLYYAPEFTWANRIDFNTFDNFWIRNPNSNSHEFDAVRLEVLGEGRICYNTFKNFRINYPGTMINLSCNGFGTTDYINYNYFYNFGSDGFARYVEFDQVTGDIDGNRFSGLSGQCAVWTEFGLCNIEGSNNYFDDIIFIDPEVPTDLEYQISISADSLNTNIHMIWANQTGQVMTDVSDLGQYTRLNSNNLGSQYMYLGKRIVVPPDTKDGMMVYADGAWDPGSGEGIYGYFDGGWNALGVSQNVVGDGDPYFNASASHGITATNIIEWTLAHTWIGDQFFNASDAEGFTWAMAAGWNTTSNIFDQELNASDDVVFNKVSTPNIDTASGGLNITSDDSYTRVTGDLNVTGTLSPTLFLIPCYGTPPATVSGMTYFNTVNNSLVVYYDGAWHFHEED